MTQNRIVRLKNKLIEDITVIEQDKNIKQNNLCNISYFESPYERKLRELTEEMGRQQMRDMNEFIKKLEKDNEKIMQEMLENMKKKKNEGC
jgi:hypothetical protein